MKVKMFVAVTTLAFIGSAQASLDVSGSGSSELLFNIFDPVADVSYSQDLGVSFDTFFSNISDDTFRLDFSLDSGALSLFSESDAENVVWNVGAANNSFVDINRLGILTTINPNSSPSNIDDAASSVIAQNYNDLVRGLNQSVDVSPVSDNEVYSNSSNAVSSAVGRWSNRFNGTTGFFNSAPVDQDMGMYFLGAFELGSVRNVESVALWSLDLDNNTLGYNAAGLSTIPLPAAFWLLLSGLVGLFVTSRRRIS